MLKFNIWILFSWCFCLYFSCILLSSFLILSALYLFCLFKIWGKIKLLTWQFILNFHLSHLNSHFSSSWIASWDNISVLLLCACLCIWVSFSHHMVGLCYLTFEFWPLIALFWSFAVTAPIRFLILWLFFC